MYQYPVWEDVLGGKPLETDTSHARRSPNDSGTRREEHGMLSVEEGALLVKTARVAVETHLSGKELQAAAEPSPSLREERGVFVTLLDHANGGNLRGCIGIPFPSRSLLEQVRSAAVEAATTDFRFEPVGLEEFRNRIVLEATVLSAMEPIWVRNLVVLRENIVVGGEGLMVDGMGRYGVLFAQVGDEGGFD